MKRTMLLGKIHRANVTMRDLNYVGSITIDINLVKAAGMLIGEKVEVYNITNGNRFATYILEGQAGSGIIGINGAAARLVSLGDKIIIVNYAQFDEDELADYAAKIVVIEDDLNLTFRMI